MYWDEVCARASGRRRYNAKRRFEADLRRIEMVRLMLAYGVERGIQKRVADKLGVSEATISRDLWYVLRSPHAD